MLFFFYLNLILLLSTPQFTPIDYVSNHHHSLRANRFLPAELSILAYTGIWRLFMSARDKQWTCSCLHQNAVQSAQGWPTRSDTSSLIENRLDTRGYCSRTTFWHGESRRTECTHHWEHKPTQHCIFPGRRCVISLVLLGTNSNITSSRDSQKDTVQSVCARSYALGLHPKRRRWVVLRHLCSVIEEVM